MSKFFLSTLPQIVEKQIVQDYGLVSANLVKTRHIGYHILSEFRLLFGGRMNSYTDLLHDTRTEVTRDLVKRAETMGANAVIGLRYQNSSITEGATEIMAYGTAVRIK